MSNLGNPKNNKFQVTFTFPTEQLMEDFCSHMSDGGGEDGFYQNEESDWNHVVFDYSRCFPAWGWKDDEPKFIDIFAIEDE